MTRGDHPRPWEPTAALVGALLVTLAVLPPALLTRRPDLVLLIVPAASLATWGLATRPRTEPSVSTRIGPTVVAEGGAVGWHAYITAPTGAHDVAAVIAPTAYIVGSPRDSALAADLPAVTGTAVPVELGTTLVATRWGRHEVGAAILAVTSALGTFRWTPRQLPDSTIIVLPGKESFATRTTMPHPRGIVGGNRSTRRGEGSDFAAVRPYGPGDRLSRIDWRLSTRTGVLQVAAMHADLDTEVMLVVDAFHDLGTSGGVAGPASSLDTAVRAATALAEHYLRVGERVGLLVLGVSGVAPVRPHAGRMQFRRIQDSLATIRPGSVRGSEDRATAALLARIRLGATVLVLTPGISAAALGRASALTASGLTVLVVDTLPRAATRADRLERADLEAIAPFTDHRDLAATRLAWRVRLLEREAQLRRLRESGLPVVSWVGPGSLDDVLRQLRRRARAPHLVRR